MLERYRTVTIIMTVLAVTTRLLCCVQVRPEMKLPLLYLIDSIMKNLNGKYLQQFSHNIVRVFCHAFESLVGLMNWLSW